MNRHSSKSHELEDIEPIRDKIEVLNQTETVLRMMRVPQAELALFIPTLPVIWVLLQQHAAKMLRRTRPNSPKMTYLHVRVTEEGFAAARGISRTGYFHVGRGGYALPHSVDVTRDGQETGYTKTKLNDMVRGRAHPQLHYILIRIEDLTWNQSGVRIPCAIGRSQLVYSLKLTSGMQPGEVSRLLLRL